MGLFQVKPCSIHMQLYTNSHRRRPSATSSTQVQPTEKFSSFNKLINVVSNVIRFINVLRIRIDCHTPQQAETEIRRIAIAKIIRQDQIQTFPDEYVILRRQAELTRKSPLLNLSPFHDKELITRCILQQILRSCSL